MEEINERLGKDSAEAIALDINYDIIDNLDFKEELDKRRGWIEIHSKAGTAASTTSFEEYDQFVDKRIREIREKKQKHPEWFKVGDRKQLPFENKSFDMIIYNNSINPALNYEKHNPAVMQIINEGLRVIKEKGQIRIIPSGLGHFYKGAPERLSQYQYFIRVGQIHFDEKRNSFNNPDMLGYFKELAQSGVKFYIIQEYDEKAEHKEERWTNGALVITKGDHKFTPDELNISGNKTRVMELELQKAESDDCIVPLSLNFESLSSDKK